MIINNLGKVTEKSSPLNFVDLEIPAIANDEILIEVSVCGVCHTELDEIEGRTPPSSLPVIPGHQVVGKVIDKGRNVSNHLIGDRVGVAWIYSSCGTCNYCISGNENLCTDFKATGRDANGGYAEYMKVHANFAYAVPVEFTDTEIAPLLCAGAIGYRSLNLSRIKNGGLLGLTGFGASGHLVLKMIKVMLPETEVYVFARSRQEQKFAIELGANWAGDICDRSLVLLDAIIDTTPVWKPVIEGLSNLKPGGRLVINAIRKEETDKEYLLNMNYTDHLWMEKEIKTVANINRVDVIDFLTLAANLEVRPELMCYSLKDANKALIDLKWHKIKGAKVLVIQ